MAETHQLRAYDYVNHPYEQVRDAFIRDAIGIFHRATHAAVARAGAIATTLRVHVGAIEVGADVVVEVEGVEEGHLPGAITKATRVKLGWRAARNAEMFPTMHAELTIYPLSTQETQLDLRGEYRPPLGAVGLALDSLVGHRIAEASVHRLVTDVAEYLRSGTGAA